LKTLTQQLQGYAAQAARLKNNDLSQLIISIDYEGGKVNRLKEKYGFPSTLSAAEIGRGSEENARKQAEQMAATLKNAGINLNFAPVVDVNVNPDNPVIGKLDRSFSADPKKVAEYAAIVANAHRKQTILCAYKHFPGHGSSTKDTHEDFVDITQTWQEYELEPYRELFLTKNEAALVMTAHVVHTGLDSNGYPASLSACITTDLLRNKLNFSGVVVTDDMQMKAITDRYGLAEAVKLAVNAGADMLVFGNNLVAVPQDPQQLVDIIYEHVRTNAISAARIDEAYQRIVRLKHMLQNNFFNKTK
jgi:beta-N-acetylhexosaminidase